MPRLTKAIAARLVALEQKMPADPQRLMFNYSAMSVETLIALRPVVNGVGSLDDLPPAIRAEVEAARNV